ncbi:hypothetical protein FOCG_15839 [Fusarium oxysporum f. sp. radicis-lycopersici 26381]|uniref:Uncharacterized protein n=1 Tax=Fusarium oxysporum Fo47 TaxID=660027 RepID=W9JIX9_FUSOX|nr:hypothetical protein FOZG_16495 [Fusarium oxysporum Fo47]EWZ81572.1 hypothetical protein FOWG_14565 [Fusarium oxysporum f. sp. lycopersici MN25]EXL41677.1 hypothetical protein FOCG_15839 [Fusarium oxysporum f. sp. radicis-lycopersici 26381]
MSSAQVPSAQFHVSSVATAPNLDVHTASDEGRSATTGLPLNSRGRIKNYSEF